MSLETRLLAEASPTAVTTERSLSRVRAHVHGEVTLLHEAATAERAREGFLPRVAAHVSQQGGPTAEALPADGAGVRTFARVDPQVRSQVPAQREALTAHPTAKRRLPVEPQVELQRLTVFQVFPAHAAVLGVCRGVSQQVAPPLEKLPAHSTDGHGGRRRSVGRQMQRCLIGGAAPLQDIR